MKTQHIFLYPLLFLFAGCTAYKQASQSSPITFYKIGHRGTRGYMPENTIPSMKKALDLGANTIEFDVHVTKDNKVVVNHDAAINPIYNSLPGKQNPDKADVKSHILYQMDYDQIREIIVGGKPYPQFHKQSTVASYMPLLTELIDSMENYSGKKVNYLLEIKGYPKSDGIEQPAPEEYMKLLMNGFNYKKLGKRLIIQSFDERYLQILNRDYPEIELGYLANKASLEEDLKKMGFKPAFYNPQFNSVTKELVDKCHSNTIKITPWTVNTSTDVKQMKEFGVDGVITDYPDLLK